MNFFDKINNYMIVNVIKEILKGWDPEESLSDSVLVGTFHKYVINCEWNHGGYERSIRQRTVYIRVVPKNGTKFAVPHFAAAHNRVMRFTIKCPEINCLHDKGQHLNAAVKYSLYCSWQVNCSKTKLTATSFWQIHKKNTVLKANKLTELRETALNVSTTRTNSRRR